MKNELVAQKKKALTPEELAECEALRQIFVSKKKALGLTQQMIADKLDVKQGSISAYMNGTNRLNLNAASVFAQCLLCDIGDFSPRLKAEALQIANKTMGLLENRAKLTSFELPKGKSIPLKSFDQIKNKNNDKEEVELMPVFSDVPDTAVWYRLESDLMDAPPTNIAWGTFVVVDPNLTPISGDIVLADRDGPVIGFYQKVGGKVLLAPAKDKIPAIEINPEDAIGVVLEWKATYKNPARG